MRGRFFRSSLQKKAGGSRAFSFVQLLNGLLVRARVLVLLGLWFGFWPCWPPACWFCCPGVCCPGCALLGFCSSAIAQLLRFVNGNIRRERKRSIAAAEAARISAIECLREQRFRRRVCVTTTFTIFRRLPWVPAKATSLAYRHSAADHPSRDLHAPLRRAKCLV